MSFIKRLDHNIIVSVLTALAVILFFGICYPHHLHFQEQFQFFLFDSDYACEVMSVPGGVADYLGRFLTQFFLYAWVGASILGVLITSVQLLTARLLGKGWLASLCLLPSLLLVTLFCDESALVGSIIAILLSQLSAWGISAIGNNTLRRVLSLVAVPVLYWALGPLAIIAVVLIVLEDLKRDSSKNTITLAILLITLALSLPSLLAPYVAVKPEEMFTGIHYLRSFETGNLYHWYAALAIVLLPLLTLFGKKLIAPIATLRLYLSTLVVAVAGVIFIVKPAVNQKAETVMAYDFMARTQQWNRIMATAKQNPPSNAICATVLNLALAKANLLGDKMFEYTQKGLGGLLPHFERDAMSPLATSEAYYHLGMINTAQRYTFEAQEAILDYQKSARCYKRLAETNLINGNYAVARKYLIALQKTLFYSDWADETLQILGNEEAINSHKEYGVLRKNRFNKDLFYNENDYLKMLGELYSSNKSNKMAFDYLLAACMLQKDLNTFVNVFGMNDVFQYNTIPTYYQQALLLWWSFENMGSKQTPPGIRPDFVSTLKRFVGDLNQHQNNPDWLEKHYGKTYWYYYSK